MSKNDPEPTPADTEETRPPSASSKPTSAPRRTYLYVVAALVIAALALVVWRISVGGPGRGRTPQTNVTPSLPDLGPLRPDDTVGDGWKIDRMVRTTTEVQIIASRAGKTFTLGLAPLADQKDTPLVPFPDIYVWYSGPADPSATGPDPEIVALIQAVVARLRESAGDKPLHERVLEWSAAEKH